MTGKQPSSRGAERQRRLRARRRNGVVRIALEISAEGARHLERLGWLGAGCGNHTLAVAEAVLAIASAAVDRGLSPSGASRSSFG